MHNDKKENRRLSRGACILLAASLTRPLPLLKTRIIHIDVYNLRCTAANSQPSTCLLKDKVRLLLLAQGAVGLGVHLLKHLRRSRDVSVFLLHLNRVDRPDEAAQPTERTRVAAKRLIQQPGETLAYDGSQGKIISSCVQNQTVRVSYRTRGTILHDAPDAPTLLFFHLNRNTFLCFWRRRQGVGGGRERHLCTSSCAMERTIHGQRQEC